MYLFFLDTVYYTLRKQWYTGNTNDIENNHKYTSFVQWRSGR